MHILYAYKNINYLLPLYFTEKYLLWHWYTYCTVGKYVNYRMLIYGRLEDTFQIQELITDKLLYYSRDNTL